MPRDIPFFTLFAAWSPTAELRAPLGETAVRSAVISRPERSLQARLAAPRPLSPETLDRAAAALAAVYGLRSVRLTLADGAPAGEEAPTPAPMEEAPPWEASPPGSWMSG